MLNRKELSAEPHASILCYPRSSKEELRKRLNELERLGVSAIEFSGEKNILNVAVLGKGCVGIVTIAYIGGRKNALKIRRVDADRASMRHEAVMLRKANSLLVGPELREVSRNFLVMQFIEGSLLLPWIKKNRGKRRLSYVLRSVMEQCFLLDHAGLDHGELSHAPKHIIIDATDRPFLVDFESASAKRRPANVTSVCQFLFLYGEASTKIRRRLGKINEKTLLSSLRMYKHNATRENFETLLDACGL
jgi:putative serine/threonine protein kinase